jgi:phosphoribosylformylglycinamidine synthase
MESVTRFAMDGGPVLGICNGFQVLLEAGLLPGAVRVNRGLRYVCRDVHMRVENASTAFTRLYEPGQIVRMPIGHGEGNYTAPPETLTELEYEAGVVFRYCDEEGRVTDEANPNGATAGIAGIANREGNVVGLMPHPDRCAEGILGNDVGRKMFESAVAALAPA